MVGHSKNLTFEISVTYFLAWYSVDNFKAKLNIEKRELLTIAELPIINVEVSMR